MSDAQSLPWDRQCLEAVKSLGKTLGQMSLYKIGHPAVAAMLKLAEDHLALAITQSEGGELTYSFDQDKLIANGRLVGAVSQLPTTLPAVFKRFKLSSITFKTGLSNAELTAFCELAASRPDSSSAADPKAYLAERGVVHIAFNEAVYAKVAEAAPAAAAKPVEEAVEPAGEAVPVERAIVEALEQQSLETTIRALVNKAVADAVRRPEVFTRVMDLIKTDINKRVDEVTQELVKDKTLLQNEQARTQSVLHSMAEGVVMVDEHGKILMMNPAAEQLYGSTLAQVAGQPLAEKSGEEHMITLAAEITTPSDRAVSPEVKVTAGDEVKRTLMSSGAVVQNEAGKVVGMVSSVTDSAKYKEVQRMQRDFVAHVTHELRAPLSSIRAALEILQGEVAAKLREEENRMLATAMKNSDRLAELINSILDFSKIESGQMTVYPKKADPEKIAREAVDSLAAWASKKRVGLALASAPELSPVFADEKRSIQVLINLLSNAIKFTPVGGQITVRVSQPPPASGTEGRFVQFSVTDTGAGIAKADQKRIFEKFVQIASGEMHVGGTGLGLAIAKALVHLQGGKMWVESDSGKGATFFFILPVYTGQKDAAPAVPARKSPPPWWKRLLGLK